MKRSLQTSRGREGAVAPGRKKPLSYGRGSLCLLGAVLALTSRTRLAWAQDEGGPIVLGQQAQKYETFHLNPASYAINLEGDYSRERDSSPAVGAQTFQETFLQEIAEISTRGYYLSPNLVDLNINLGVGLSQAFDRLDFRGVRSSDQNTDYLYNWDLGAAFLENTNNPFRIFSKRQEQWINRQFGPTIQSTTTDTGASLDLKNGPIPSHFSYSHLENAQDDVTGTQQLNFTSDVFSWFSSAQLSANNSLDWSYNFANVNEEGFTSTHYQTQDMTLRDTYRFGSHGSQLISTVHYNDQVGSFNNQNFRWSEYLTLQHTPTFETHYRYDLDQYSFSNTTTTVNRGLAGFSHRLFESLITSGNLGVNDSASTGGADTREYLANLNLDYHKKVPLGILTSTLGYSWDRNASSGGGVGAPVLNQSKAFDALDQITLTGFQVAGPIVVTDANHAPLVQGVDYTVDRSHPNQIIITRLPAASGGHINPGDTVLLSYRLAPLPTNTTDTNIYFGTLRYDIDEGIFKGLGVFTRLTVSDQDINTANPSFFTPNDFTDTTAGADYRFWNFTLNYEHEIHDSTINPFSADRAGASWTQRLTLDTTASASTTYNLIQYTQPHDQVTLYTVAGSIHHSFSNELTGLLTALYRNERQDIGGNTNGFESQIELHWQHRQTTVYARFRYSFYDTNHNKQDFQFFQLGVRREF